jgi:co-chaperonin GroES (HSP10)
MKYKNEIEPNYGQVVLRPIEDQEERYGNIIVPDVGKEKPEIAEILKIEDTYNWHTGKFFTPKFSVGDIVIIPKMGVMKISLNNEELYICQENQISGKLTKLKDE